MAIKRNRHSNMGNVKALGERNAWKTDLCFPKVADVKKAKWWTNIGILIHRMGTAKTQTANLWRATDLKKSDEKQGPRTFFCMLHEGSYDSNRSQGRKKRCITAHVLNCWLSKPIYHEGEAITSRYIIFAIPWQINMDGLISSRFLTNMEFASTIWFH